jgi:hypothetical protein
MSDDIVVLPEHQHRADFPEAFTIFTKHNRFAGRSMDDQELASYNVDPAKVRFFSMDVEKFRKAGVLGIPPVQTFSAKKHFAMDVRMSLNFPIQFFSIDAYGIKEEDIDALMTLVKIWRGEMRYSSQDVIPQAVQKMLKFVTKWPLVIRQTGSLIVERSFIYNDEKGEFDYDLEAQLIYEILQIGWGEEEVYNYLKEANKKKK